MMDIDFDVATGRNGTPMASLYQDSPSEVSRHCWSRFARSFHFSMAYFFYLCELCENRAVGYFDFRGRDRGLRWPDIVAA